MSDTLVIYASYGSNLLEERFLRYIVGGTIKGNTINHSGSRDNTLPREKMSDHLLNPASIAYLDVIRRGLIQTFPNFAQRDINDYLTKMNGAPLPFELLLDGDSQ